MTALKKKNSSTRKHIAFLLAVVSFGLLLVGTGIGSAMTKSSRADKEQQINIEEKLTPTPSLFPTN